MNTAIILDAKELAQAAGALRSNSKMAQLTDEHFAMVVEWLAAGTPPEQIYKLSESAGLPASKLPAGSPFYRFWSWFRPYYFTARRRYRATLARASVESATGDKVDWDAATREALMQETFETLNDPDREDKLAGVLVNGYVRMRSQDLDREKIALAERRLALLEKQATAARKILGTEKLTPEARALKLKEIFGLAA